MTPLVSVVMSVYNGAEHLAATLDSILAQTLENFELVAVDDGSRDGTLPILAAYAHRDPRVRVIAQENRGLTRALIAGCAEARGRFIARHDAGDLSHPRRLETQQAMFAAEPELAFVSCATEYVGPEGEPLWIQRSTGAALRPASILDPSKASLISDGPTHHGSVMFRRDLYERAGGYRAEFYYGQDFDLWFRMAALGKFQCGAEVLYTARVTPDSISSSARAEQQRVANLSRAALQARLRGESDAAVLAEAAKVRPAPAGRRSRRRSAGLYFIGEALRRHGDRRARRYLVRALMAWPFAPRPWIRLTQALIGRARSIAPNAGRSDRLRILMLADTPADPNLGAAGTEVQTMWALRGIGEEVDAIWSDGLRRRIGHGNMHVLLELPRAYERAALDALSGKPYDVVHINQPHGFRAARAIHRVAPRTIVVHRSHGFELNVEDTLRPWRERFRSDRRNVVRRLASHGVGKLLARHGRAIAREADGHIVSSSLDAAYLRDRLGVPEERIVVVAHAAPDSYLRVPAPPMTEARLRHVLHAAQFAFFKAPMITAAAMNQIAQARPEARFTWVCDRAHHREVRALLSPAANERAELLSWMPQDELINVYDGAGVFLFPSFYEGFGKVFLEAMARGACVVATPVGGAIDLITDGVDGLLVEPGDAGATAAAALSLMSDPARAARMSEAAAVTARRYSWTGLAEKLADFYRRRLAARSA